MVFFVAYYSYTQHNAQTIRYNFYMRFQVPQFIDVEDKIFGPFTLKQFIYLAGGAGLSFTIFTLVSPKLIAIVLIIPIIILSLALTFYKDQAKRPFIDMLESAFYYYTRGRLYIWKKVPKKIDHSVKKEVTDTGAETYVPRLSDSKLKDLAWSLDIHESKNNHGN